MAESWRRRDIDRKFLLNLYAYAQCLFAHGTGDYRQGGLRTYVSNREVGCCFFGKRLMSASQLIDNATFGPEALRAIGEAFDAAWAEIATGVGTDPVAIELARLKLANAVLNVAEENSRDVEALKRAALQPTP
jgi:hypothetical protein